MTHEASLKALIKGLFPKINVNLIELPTLATSDLIMISVTAPTSIIKEPSSQVNPTKT